MNQKVKFIAYQYRLNGDLVAAALKGMSEADISARIQDDGNSMKWIVGHMAWYRFLLNEHLGGNEENPFGDLFKRGAEVKPEAEYPSLDEIRKVWDDIAAKVDKRLEELSDEELAAPLEEQYPINDGTVMGAIAFLSLHETYHVGQLAYIRCLHGGDGIVG